MALGVDMGGHVVTSRPRALYPLAECSPRLGLQSATQLFQEQIVSRSSAGILGPQVSSQDTEQFSSHVYLRIFAGGTSEQLILLTSAGTNTEF